jgi:hypothetical protein
MFNPFVAVAAGAAVCLCLSADASLAAGLPTTVDQCAQTTVAKIESRLEGTPESGSAIAYANGGYQVSYDVIEGIVHSKRGDRVKLCLISIPEDCPPGDNRGRVYRATNLRTHEVWEAPDAEHMCGGA